MTDPQAPFALPEPTPSPPDGYLDAVAGQPLLPVARQAWNAAMDQSWSDPARLHHSGRRAGLILDSARASIAAGLGVRADDVFFTSSGPTALAAAVAGLMTARAPVSARAVMSSVESMAVQEPVRRHAREVTVVGVDGAGRLDLEALEAQLDAPAALLCVQAANAEVGTRQPLHDVAGLARSAGVPLLVHAVQVIGRDPIPDDWDLLAASARDWGGPAGVGVLAVRPQVRWRPDASPDRGWVGGFPDIPGAAAAAAALEYVTPFRADEAARAFALVERLRTELPRRVDGLAVAGHASDRLPHIVTFTCSGVTGEALVIELDRRGFSVASGSACTSDARLPSQVLLAMGMAPESSIRVSLPFGCSPVTVEAFLSVLPDAVATARAD